MKENQPQCILRFLFVSHLMHLFHSAMQEQQQATETSSNINHKGSGLSETNKQNDQPPSDARVKQLKDQLIQAKVYLSLPVVKSNPHLTRELRLRVKEVSRTLGEAIKDSDLPRKYVHL